MTVTGAPFLLILVGLIFRVTSGWFPSQHVVGDVLMLAGVAVFLLIFAILFLIGVLVGWATGQR